MVREIVGKMHKYCSIFYIVNKAYFAAAYAVLINLF